MTNSRGSNVDTQKCVETVGGNKYDLVLIASLRCKELRRQNANNEKFNSVYAPVTSLLEIQEGKIGKDYLRRV